MNNLISLTFNDHMFDAWQDEKGVFWFTAKAVAGALGYSDTDDAVRRHCKNPTSAKVLEEEKPGVSPGFSGKSLLISESDLYRLVLRSQLESADKFTDWVVEEVLPSIRKHGTYPPPSEEEQKEVLMLEHFDDALKGLRALKDMTHEQRVAVVREMLSTGEFNITELLSANMKADLRYFTEQELKCRGHYMTIHAFRDALVCAGLNTPDLYFTDLGRRFGKAGVTGPEWRLETLDYIKVVAERKYKEWKKLNEYSKQ